jgi:hypothetical protein
MNGAFKVDELSFRRVEVGLKNIGERVPNHASRAMRRAANRIVKKARIFVPEDTQALKDSIRVETSRGVRGRLMVSVIAGGQEVITIKGRQVNLDQYAAIIHEAYSEMTPGEETLKKMELHPGVHIGEGFLSRASDEEGDVLRQNMIEDFTKIIKSEGFK